MDISAALMHAGADEDIYVKNTPKLCTIGSIMTTGSRNPRDTKSESTVARLFSWKRERNGL